MRARSTFGFLPAALMVCAAIFSSTGASTAANDPLTTGFRNPPLSARPWVYWFWLNGNITREGITADLEAMKRVGIGGVLIMEVDQGAPVGSVDFAGPKWRELFHFMLSEAGRLGIEVNMNDDAGWNGSGGPWITPDVAMQKLVWTETTVEGPRHFDAVLPQPQTNVGYYRDVAMLAYPTPSDYRIPDLPGKTALIRQDVPSHATWPTVPADQTIAAGRIMDISAQSAPDGHIAWDVPAGKWTLLRLGYTPTGSVNAPAPETGRGLECDKLSKEGSEAAFNGLMAKLIAESRPLVGKTLVSTHIDSWENGSQNWTPKFREEFRRLRGYDPLLFLPAMTGRVVDSLEVSERFLWDVRQTVADLVHENYAGHMHDLAKKQGIRLSIEAYGDCVFDDMTYAGRADEPMTEFWSWPGNFTAGIAEEMRSAAHVYGKRILGAEAFTAGDGEKWLYHPASIKALGDWAFCQGVNRFVFHRYALQPWRDRKPGMGMGPWGLHYERTNTWWEQSKPWHTYLSRCQYLLRQGLPVGDILYLSPEGAPRGYSVPPSDVLSGYRCDICPPEVVMTRLSVKKGLLTLPDGMTYRALVLPAVETMTPALLESIEALADAGALIVGTRPQKSPGLSDYPRCDTEVKRLTDALWGSGKIVTERTAEQALLAKGVPPDFRADRLLDSIHRRTPDSDIYFVSNGSKHAVNAACEFRIASRVPELWNPETGQTTRVADYSVRKGVTRLTLRLEETGSTFVIFRNASAPVDTVARLTKSGKTIGLPTDRKPVVIRRALWGPAGDVRRMKDVTKQVRRMMRERNGTFMVAELAAEGDPAFGVVKTLRVEYEIAGRVLTASATDSEPISFELPADRILPVRLERAPDGGLIAEAKEAGDYRVTLASGRTLPFRVSKLPGEAKIEGPWTLSFPAGSGAPANTVFDKLTSWSESPEPAARYFSGTAVYHKKMLVSGEMLGSRRRLMLNLGRVEVIATVKLNGKSLAVLWKAPYSVDITKAAKPGINELEIAVVNLWPNRMIGDEQLPEDSDRNPDGTLRAWPEWLSEGKPSPTGRTTFASWRLWKKDSALLPSGLLGPVTLRTTAVVRVSP